MEKLDCFKSVLKIDFLFSFILLTSICSLYQGFDFRIFLLFCIKLNWINLKFGSEFRKILKNEINQRSSSNNFKILDFFLNLFFT